MADVFDQAAGNTKPSKSPKQQAAAPSKGGDVFDQAAVSSAPAQQSQQGMPLADTAWDRMKQAYEGNLPLLDENMATLAGVGSIARGGVGAAKGLYELLRQAGRAWNDPKAEVGDVALPQPQIGQIPGAIRDINASPDPTGTYLKAAGETAGQGAGAALTALATEGAARGLPKAIEAAADIPAGRLANAAGAGIKAGAGKFPIVGPPIKAAALAALRSWRNSAPGEAGQLANSVAAPSAPPVNPAVISPSRTLPGMNPPEVIRPPAQPIPPRQGLMLPGETEKLIPSSKVSTTPPTKSSQIAQAKGIPAVKDMSTVLPRLREIAQQIQAKEASAPASADLTPALEKSLQPRIEGKIMQVLRKEGLNSTIGMEKLMDAPELKGISREQVQAAARSLRDSGKVWGHEARGAGEEAPSIYGIALRKR